MSVLIRCTSSGRVIDYYFIDYHRVGTELNPVRVFDGFSLADCHVPISGVTPRGNVVLKPCLAGIGATDYLCFPDSVGCGVNIIDLISGECVNECGGHLDVVTCCCFRSQMSELYSGGRDGFVLKYDCVQMNESGMKNDRLRGCDVVDEENDIWEDDSDD